jgi:hypothetical protein
LVLLVLKSTAEDIMSNSRQYQLCKVGCQAHVPTELETEGLCILHFLSWPERACSEMRREAASGDLFAARRTQIETYIATSAMKLACVGTGSLRVSDEMKRRLLTTFLTLMILRENLDRDSSQVVPRLRTPNLTEAVAVLG